MGGEGARRGKAAWGGGCKGRRTVPRSFSVMLNEEAPSTRTTILSGLATWAPMAEGRPKPIVPSEPEVIIERGWIRLMAFWTGRLSV